MNREQIRGRVQRLASWRISDADEEGIAAFNQCIEDGYNRLVAECPEAIAPDIVRYVTQQAYNGIAGVTLNTTTDPYVLQFIGSGLTLVTDGTWNGVYTLVVEYSTGQFAYYKAREFWETLLGQKYVSLDRPWSHGTMALNAKWYLLPNTLWLPQDTIKLQAVQIMGVLGQPVTLTPRYQTNQFMNFPNLPSLSWQSTGVPSNITRQSIGQIPAPTKALTPSVTAGPWSADPPGTFQYRYTLCEGYHDADLKTPGGSYQVIRESSPSPETAEVTATAVDSITLDIPDYAWEMNFGDGTTLRHGHTGRFVRIYRKRVALTAGTSGPTNIEVPDLYQFWQDVWPGTTTVVDNGTVLPDYSLRIPDSYGFQAWEVYPIPTTRTEYRMQVLRRPPKLETDTDAPKIADDATDALCLWAAYYVAKLDKDAALSRVFMDEARNATENLRASYASPTPRISRVPWDGSPVRVQRAIATERT